MGDGDAELLERITANPQLYGGKPILSGHPMAVEHVLQLMGAGTIGRRDARPLPLGEVDEDA